MNRVRSDHSRRRLVAVLGPTNTGKTHLAVERLLSHASGMIGLPLRLLAREVYDRVVAQRGPRQVALLTGEERIMPPRPNYIICTVESMPMDRPVEFLAIDEIQLCADFDRGHVFTDRLLNARGFKETMFLGSETMRPVLKQLLPELEFISRPRFSDLGFAGHKKITRLPRRSAVVAFSANDVYALAELIRRQRGGAAVVMGALSPRTRNAQVALYQSGEVDFLVATDAIGMGLNMNVDHVAFAGTRKFDGLNQRPLTPAEVGQIAGRAGRYMNNGTFGLTAAANDFDGEMVEMVESHRFNPVERLQWRNSRLDFSSLHALRHSLKRRPRQEQLVQARDADDVQAFDVMTTNQEILDRLQHPEAIHHLWDVCRVPDFRQSMSDAHHRLLQQLFLQLTGEDGVVAEDWLAPRIDTLDRTDGDMDALSHRLAHMRTWTYVANRANWLRDPGHWRERTRALEDRLSDALHAALTQRFVDRRTATLYRSLKSKSELFGAVTADGDVLVEGQFVGKLQGLTFVPDAAADLADGRAIRTAANRVLARELDKIAAQLVDAPDGEISWRDDNRLWWRGARVAKLLPSGNLRRPRLEILETDHISGSWREQVRRRLLSWLEGEIDRLLSPLLRLEKLSLSAPGRGLVFQLTEGLGQSSRAQLEVSIATLSKGEKRQLSRVGVQFGYVDIYIPALLRPERVQLKARLWSAQQANKTDWSPPRPGLVSVDRESEQSDAFYAICGFRSFRNFVVRMDIVDRLAGLAHLAAVKGPFAPDHAMMSLAGRPAGDLDQILKALGYRGKQIDGILKYRFKGKKTPSAKKPKTPTATAPSGPFAELRNLKVRRH